MLGAFGVCALESSSYVHAFQHAKVGNDEAIGARVCIIMSVHDNITISISPPILY